MNKKQAINIIKEQIIKLDIKENQNHNWTLETRTYLKRIFGEESPQQNNLHYFSFDNAPGGKLLDDKIVDKKQFLNDCINTIKNIGVYKPPIKNLLSTLSNQVIGLIITLLTGLIILVNSFLSSHKTLRLELENEKLKDSISIIRKTIPQPKHKDSIK